MPMKKGIVITEGHANLPEGLRMHISSNIDLEIVGEECDGLGATRLAGPIEHDLILPDLSMPAMNSIKVAEKVIAGYHEEKRSVGSSTSLGARSCLELEILDLTSEGCTNQGIPAYMCSNAKVVETNRSNLMEKFHLYRS
jgi:DNA-binding NarL/FixJ family response regulator